MDARRRVLAMAVLSLAEPGAVSDAEFSTWFADDAEVSSTLSYVLGFSLQALAHERGETVDVTVAYLRRLLGEGGGSALAPSGVRPPALPPVARD